MKHSHYHKSVAGLASVDIYRVCKLFGVQDDSGALQHAVKKVLCAGQRGAKDKAKDVREAIDTLSRWLVMQSEDEFAAELLRAVESGEVTIEPASEIDDDSPRQQITQQGGELAVEVYARLDALHCHECAAEHCACVAA